MGFADYLSRHPKQSPPPPSTDDTQYIVNLKNYFKIVRTQNSINHISATLTNSSKYQTKHLTANNSTCANKYDSAFCLNPSNFQPLSLSHSISYNSKVTSINSSSFNNAKQFPQGYRTIKVNTRSRPKLNTFEQKIIKRKRAPNKKNIKMNNHNTTIATKTADNKNKRLVQSAIRPDPLNPIYHLSNTANMPQYSKNLSQVFGEEFIAEATQKDRQMAPIIKLIKDKDWETLKRVSPYFYSLKRDLSITPSGCVLYDNRLMVPSSLKQLVINSLHQTHPGQSGTL